MNDDGPPSNVSPYIHPFVKALERNGHVVSVVIPASSRSWIAKAHIRETILKANYIFPQQANNNALPQQNHFHGQTKDKKDEKGKNWPWVVITNGTPASCVQLALYGNIFPHHYHDLDDERPPIDLVISGPNHGRNASSIYNLSSGTVGGALEAATCKKRAIALSFASKDEQPPTVIDAASRLAVRVVERLCSHWDDGVEVYNVNVPMRADVEGRPVRYTTAFKNYWSEACLYAEVEGADHHINGTGDGCENGNGYHERYFSFSPDLSAMKKDLWASPEGTDAHTVLNGYTR